MTNPVVLFPSDDYITYLNNRHSLLHIPTEDIDICDLSDFPAHTFPSLYTLNSTVSLERSGIGEIQRIPALALFGQGVIVVVIDTGIDYQHPAFRNSDGSTVSLPYGIRLSKRALLPRPLPLVRNTAGRQSIPR